MCISGGPVSRVSLLSQSLVPHTGLLKSFLPRKSPGGNCNWHVIFQALTSTLRYKGPCGIH